MTQLIKTEFFGGPKDGDKIQWNGESFYMASGDSTLVHAYARRKLGMVYSGTLERQALDLKNVAVQPFKVCEGR